MSYNYIKMAEKTKEEIMYFVINDEMFDQSREFILNRMKTLKIVLKSSGKLSNYSPKKNTITLNFKNNNFISNQGIINHEFMHITGSLSLERDEDTGYYYKKNNFFDEAINEMLANEVCQTYYSARALTNAFSVFYPIEKALEYRNQFQPYEFLLSAMNICDPKKLKDFLIVTDLIYSKPSLSGEKVSECLEILTDLYIEQLEKGNIDIEETVDFYLENITKFVIHINVEKDEGLKYKENAHNSFIKVIKHFGSKYEKEIKESFWVQNHSKFLNSINQNNYFEKNDVLNILANKAYQPKSLILKKPEMSKK